MSPIPLFLPSTPLPSPPTSSISSPSIVCSPRSPPVASLTRRSILRILPLLPLPLLPFPSYSAPAPSVGYIDISIAGTPRGRITFSLFSNLAPSSVALFSSLLSSTFRDRAGRNYSYRYTIASKVVPNRYIELGKVSVSDQSQLPGTPARQPVGVSFPLNNDVNDVKLGKKGVVAMRSGGGGTGEFRLILGDQDTEGWIAVGEVVEGQDVLEKMGKVPVNRKTIRDGYRNVGKAIGDARANVDVSYLSSMKQCFQKERIYNIALTCICLIDLVIDSTAVGR